MSEIEQLKERIRELEYQLAESRICEICKDKAVLAADKYREQNAKLIEALSVYADRNNYYINDYDDWCTYSTRALMDGPELAAEALKEVQDGE